MTEMPYPELGLLKPTMRFYQCPRCNGNLRTQLKAQIQKPKELVFCFQCHDCSKAWYISSKLVLNSIFEDQLQKMAEYTKATGKEFGGLIIKTSTGIRIEMVQVGEDMSVSFGQSHELEEGESLVGTVHNHPYTDIPSDWDIGTFLQTDWEAVGIVNGANGTINVMVKRKDTVVPLDLEQWIKDSESLTFKAKGNLYNFVIYRGRINNLQQLTSFTDVMAVTSVEQLLTMI
jgi:proteasome lid subunit RPN8/RPN11